MGEGGGEGGAACEGPGGAESDEREPAQPSHWTSRSTQQLRCIHGGKKNFGAIENTAGQPMGGEEPGRGASSVVVALEKRMNILIQMR